MYVNRLKGLMKENQHTQKFVADLLGLSLFGFNGKNEFKANEIKKLSELYGVSTDYFFSELVAKMAIK